MADTKIWTVDITDEDREIIKKMNTNIEDLVKKFGGGDTGISGTGGHKAGGGTPAPTPTPGSGSSSAIPSPTPPTTATPSSTPPAPTPPAGGGGGAGGSGGAPGSEMEGGFNPGESFEVTGIKNGWKEFRDWIDPSSFVMSGNAYPTNDQVMDSARWRDFESVFRSMKKEIKKIQNEEIEEVEYQRRGSRLNVTKYARGESKYMKKKTIPERENNEVNIIIALDHSGSVGSGVGSTSHDMSGAALAVVKCLEHQRIQYSLMIYADEVALIECDKKGRSIRSNILAANTAGTGGNEESVVLQVADKIASQNPGKANVFIIINDGGVDTSIYDDVVRLRERKRSPLTTHCVGIGNGFSKENAESAFGKGFVYHTTKETIAKKITSIIRDELDKVTKGEM